MFKLTESFLEEGGDDDSDDEDYVPSETGKRKRKVGTDISVYKRLHTCLLGQPGTGKTTFAKLMVDVWDALGIVDKNKFIVTGRGDWVAKYHGHSSQKAKKLIKSAKKEKMTLESGGETREADKTSRFFST